MNPKRLSLLDDLVMMLIFNSFNQWHMASFFLMSFVVSFPLECGLFLVVPSLDFPFPEVTFNLLM